jgi:RNA polymerase sigma factor (sigma-70 family)
MTDGVGRGQAGRDDEEGAVQPRHSSATAETSVEATDGRSGTLDGDVRTTGRAEDLAEVTTLVRRVAGARLRDPHLVEDVVQETLAKLMASRASLDASAIGPYAIVTARNLVTTHWRRDDTSRRHAHRLVDLAQPPNPEDDLLLQEENQAVGAALARLSEREREGLLAHEVEGQETGALARRWDTTPGAVAAQLSRARAKLRVEYLLHVEGSAPPTDRCRPVLMALSTGEGRRQRELDVGYHLLECDFCGQLSGPLLDRRQEDQPDVVRVTVVRDADVVLARQRAREVATDVGFAASDATLVATAVSEIARNIVQFAKRGDVAINPVERGEQRGVTVVARDAGPGIADVEQAMQDGHSSYGGMGLGLPGCRRLMDEFEISSEVDRGTTVVMTKWRS